MIGLGSPYPGREPTIPLVAGPDRGPARDLGDRARPTRHHPDPPTPFAHGTLPAVRPTIGPRPQPLRADPGPSLRSVGIFGHALGSRRIENEGFFDASGANPAENVWAHDRGRSPCRGPRTRGIGGCMARSG